MSDFDYVPLIKVVLTVLAIAIFIASGLAYKVLEFIFGVVIVYLMIPVVLVILYFVMRY